MQLSRSRRFSKKRILLFSLAGVVLIGASILGGFYTYKKIHHKTQSTTQSSSLQKDSSSSLGHQTTRDPSAPQTGVDDPSLSTNDSSAGAAAFPTTKPDLTAKIAQISQSGKTLTITPSITPAAHGECRFELTPNTGTPIAKSTVLIPSGNSSLCSDTALDVSSMPLGQATLTLKVISGSNVATATTVIVIK